MRFQKATYTPAHVAHFSQGAYKSASPGELQAAKALETAISVSACENQTVFLHICYHFLNVLHFLAYLVEFEMIFDDLI